MQDAMEDEDEQFYVLDEDRNPVAATEAQWNAFPTEMREVGRTSFFNGKYDVEVTTYFDGVDSGWGDDPVPQLFATVVVVGADGFTEDTYGTWAEAEAGHAKAVAKWGGPALEAPPPAAPAKLPLFDSDTAETGEIASAV